MEPTNHIFREFTAAQRRSDIRRANAKTDRELRALFIFIVAIFIAALTILVWKTLTFV